MRGLREIRATTIRTFIGGKPWHMPGRYSNRTTPGMTDSPRAQADSPPRSSAPARPQWAAASFVSVQVFGPLALLVLAFCPRFISGEALWTVEFAIAATLLSAGIWSAIRRQNIESELSRLVGLLPEVRQTHEPIESLSKF